MIKKNWLMIIAFGFGSNIFSAEVQSKNVAFAMQVPPLKTVGSVVAAGAVSGFAMYVYCREANSAKVEKIERLWRHVTDNVAKVRPEDFSRLVAVFKDFDMFVYELKQDVGSRYNSWLTPWNWLPSMRLAYKKVVMLELLCKYLDVLRYWQPVMQDSSIEQLARPVCGDMYSATIFVKILNEDINSVQHMMKDVFCSFGNTLCDHLKAIRDMTMQSNAYRRENPRPINQV